MLKAIHYRRTAEQSEFWFVCEGGIIHLPTSGGFCMTGQVPPDAPEIPQTDTPQNTGHLPTAFIGSRLLGIYGDGDPYMLRFENGGVITIMYDYPYSDPTEGTPFWALDFYTSAQVAEDADFRQHVEEVCTESQRVDIRPSDEAPAPPIQQIRYYARRIIIGLLVAGVFILQVQQCSQPPAWQFSLPICWFMAYLYYIGIPLLGTLLFFALKARGISCRVPLAISIIAGHLLAGLLEQFDTQFQFTTTMGKSAYGISLFAFVYYLIVLMPGLCVCLFMHGAWKNTLHRLGNIAEMLLYLLLTGSLLWLCVMFCINPFEI